MPISPHAIWNSVYLRYLSNSVYQFCYIKYGILCITGMKIIVTVLLIDVFLELSCFFYDPSDVGNLISCSSAFSKPNLKIWKFTLHVLLKPGLENFQHYFGSLNIIWHQRIKIVFNMKAKYK